MTAKVQDSFLLPGQSLDKTGVSMVIYGSPGVGKTANIKSLLGWNGETNKYDFEPYCKPEEILVLDVESGRSVLTKDDKLCCNVYPVDETLEKFKEMIEYLIEKDHPFKYIFLDNASELEKYFVFALTKKRGKEIPDWKEWGNASVYVRKYLRNLRDLTHRGINVIFNFWDMTDKVKDSQGEIESVICPMCMSKTWKEYVGLVEHSAYMGISPKSGKRFFQFETHGMIQAKTRHPNMGEGAGKFFPANLAEVFKCLNS